MLEKVIAIVAEGLGVEAGNLNAETTFESLGADSLDLMDMVMNLRMNSVLKLMQIHGDLKDHR